MWVSEVYLKNSCRVIVAENHAGWSHFMVTMECNESYNLVSSRGSLFTCDCIPPKHRYICVVSVCVCVCVVNACVCMSICLSVCVCLCMLCIARECNYIKFLLVGRSLRC